MTEPGPTPLYFSGVPTGKAERREEVNRQAGDRGVAVRKGVEVRAANRMEAQRRKAQCQELGDWLARYHWQVYVSPTFKVRVSDTPTLRDPGPRGKAGSVIGDWLKRIGPGVYGYVTYEVGTDGDRIHCHALLGGLPSPKRVAAQVTRMWERQQPWFAGKIDAQRYDPKRGAAWYVTKFPFGGEVYGSPKRHRRRQRRKVHTT